jgi:hypothetical protein
MFESELGCKIVDHIELEPRLFGLTCDDVEKTDMSLQVGMTFGTDVKRTQECPNILEAAVQGNQILRFSRPEGTTSCQEQGYNTPQLSKFCTTFEEAVLNYGLSLNLPCRKSGKCLP